MNINSINTIIYNTQYLKKQSALHTERLSSGLKINHASDDPSLISRINRLNAEIRGKDTANKNIQDGVSLIQTAENSLSTMKNIGDRLKELSVHYNSDTLNEDDKKAIENESKDLLKEMNSIKDKTKFNGLNVFSKTNYDIQTGANACEKYTIKMPNIKGVSNEELDKGKLNNNNCGTNISTNSSLSTKDTNLVMTSMTGTMTNEVQNQTESATISTNSSIYSTSVPRYTLLSPTINIPDQNGYTGYKKVSDSNGNLLYEGNLNNGKLDGYGTLYNNGQVEYQGDFSNNIYNGYGTIYNTNGSIKYQGDISNGTPNGWGSYYTDNGVIQYQGSIKDGYREGWGTTYDSNGNYVESKNYTDYSSNSNTTPSTGGNTSTGGGTTAPSTGTGSNTGTTPSTGTGGTGSNTGTGTTPSTGGNTSTGGGNTIPSTGTNTGTNPSTGTGGGNTSGGTDTNNSMWSTILNSDYIDKNILNPISEGLSSLGTQEEILNSRYDLNENQNDINESNLSNIQDADIAKELLDKSKADILSQVNASLFSSQLEDDKNYILTLLR